MTENQAIERMKYRIKTATEAMGKGVDGKAYEDMEMAVKALERRTAKKPIKYGYTRQGLDNDGNSISKQEDCYECPACESFLGYVSDCKDENYQDCYCRACGQALKWEENEND